MGEGDQDRSRITRKRASAAIEWRTIPPTINVRYKKRPPPLTLLSKRSEDAPVYSPGSAQTTASVSSFTLSAASSVSPPSSASQLAFTSPPASYRAERLAPPRRAVESARSLLAVNSPEPIFEEADSADVATPPIPGLQPPEDIIRRLVECPWDLREYLHLMSLCAVCTESRPSTLADWDRVASTHNSVAPIRRSTWECWHRWAVPWTAGLPDSRSTFPNVPGMKHWYRYIDMQKIIDLYVLVSTYAGAAHSIPVSSISAHKRHHTPRHPSYPAPNEPPNVPKRTLGDIEHRGILPWFRATAVNTPILRLQHDLRVGMGGPESSGQGLPLHLHRLRIPPPPPRRDR